MKNKKIIMIFTIAFIIVVIGGYIAIKYTKNNNESINEMEEYTPQEEIAEEQTRQTIVSLYFQSKETKELVPEARLIDIKEIINNPYEKLMQLLIEGPKNEKARKRYSTRYQNIKSLYGRRLFNIRFIRRIFKF